MRAIEKAARALEYAWESDPDCPGEMYAREADRLARAAVLAFLEGVGVEAIAEAWQAGFSSALDNLENMQPGPLGSINEALKRSAGQSVLAALRAEASDEVDDAV